MEVGNLNLLTVTSKGLDFGICLAYAECFRKTGRRTLKQVLTENITVFFINITGKGHD